MGSFTTVRLQNRERGGFAERDGESCFIKDGRWYEGQDSGGKCTFMGASPALKEYLTDYFKRHPRDPSFNRSSIPRGMATMDYYTYRGIFVLLLYACGLNYFHFAFAFLTAEKRIRHFMSNGFGGIVLAMHMCASVDVYGFAHSTKSGNVPTNEFSSESEMAYYFKKHQGLVPNQLWGRPEVILKVLSSIIAHEPLRLRLSRSSIDVAATEDAN